MRVLYICSSIPSGGIHYYASLFPEVISKFGIEPIVLSGPGEFDPGIRKRLLSAGLEVIDLQSLENVGIGALLTSARDIAGILRKWSIDIIHVFGFRPALRCLMAQFLFHHSCSIPVVVTLTAARHGQWGEWLTRAIYSQMFNWTNCTVCLQCTLEFKKMRSAGLKRSNALMIPFWIDYKRFETFYDQGRSVRLPFYHSLEGRFPLVYPARFHKVKGHQYLLRVVKLVVKRFPECIFVLPGEGPLLEPMRSLAADLGVANDVLFVGRLSVQQVHALLRRCKIGLVPSLAETFSMLLTEYLLANLPVVSTDVGLALDLAQIGGVMMVPRADPEAMAEVIIRLIGDENLRKQIAERGRPFVLEYCEINKIARRYKEVYERCLSR